MPAPSSRSAHAACRSITRFIMLLFCMLALAIPATAAPPISRVVESPEDKLSFVTIAYRDRAQLQQLAARFQHMIVDRASKTVRTEASGREIAQLQQSGWRVEIDRTATDRMRKVETALASGQFGTRSISGYACYRTVEETYATIDQLVANKPALASVSNIGPSWLKARNAGGYEMKVLRLTNSATNASRPNKAPMVLFGSIHAREYTPAELVTRFAEWLVNGYGSDSEATWLLDNHVFYLVLQANPDGRKKAESGLSWRKNVNNTNGSCSVNSIGTDLNRNFPFHWNTVSGGSSGNACVDTYRGPSPQSEPETQNLMRLVAGTPGAGGAYSGGIFPDRRGDAVSSAAPEDYQGIFMDIHSFSQLVLWSWGDTTSPAPNGPALRTLGRRMAFFNDYRPQQSNELYGTDGTTDDTMYGLLGVPSYTLELGVAFFESCSSFESSTLPKNLAALKYAARNLNAPYRYPSGPNTVSVSTSSASVTAGTPVTISAIVDDSQFNQTNGTEATQAIASARLFVDAPPWESSTSGIAMSASDGSFNTTRETVSASLSTTGMAPGRHLIYVQATDASGKVGTPNAVILNIASGGGGAQTYSNGTDVAIADNSTVQSTITVSGRSGNASSTTPVTVNIVHTYIGDLKVDLIAPDGSVYVLHNRTGGGTDNINSTYTANLATEALNGTWTLRVNDNASGDTGYINQWSMTF
jgi:carboxypeptidase T